MPLSRSSTALSALLLGLVLGAAHATQAQQPLDILIVDRGSRELARKLRAEISYAGFSARDGGADVARSATGAQAPATLFILSKGRVELSVARAGDAARFDSTLVRRPGEGESFALRVVEQLRARLVDVGWTIPSEPAAGAEVHAGREGPSSNGPGARLTDAPARSGGASDASSAPTVGSPETAGESGGPPSPNEAAGSQSASPGNASPRNESVASSDGPDAVRVPSSARSGRPAELALATDGPGAAGEDGGPGAPLRLWLEAGVAVSFLRGAPSVTPHAMLGARLDPGADWSASLSALWPLAGDDVPGDAGNAHVRWIGATLALSRLVPLPAPWLMSAGLGAGLFVLDADGEARDGFEGQDVRLYAGAYFAELDAGRSLTSGLRVRARASGGLSTPRWVLHADGSDLIRLGRFFGSLGLALELSWPSAREEPP